MRAVPRASAAWAQGVVMPHVNTAEEARAVVNAAKFHPIGARGMFTSRQGMGVADYTKKANDETLVSQDDVPF